MSRGSITPDFLLISPSKVKSDIAHLTTAERVDGLVPTIRTALTLILL